MTADSNDDDRGNARATVREVYHLVDKTRTDLSKQVDDVRRELIDQVGTLASGVSLLSTTQEHRVTVLETVVAQNGEAIDGLRSDVEELRTAHQRALGHIGAMKVAGGVLGGAGAIVLGDLMIKWFGG